jgi:HD-GYP domain-containing protein (c-di-GMP phosphodiesterase class II)
VKRTRVKFGDKIAGWVALEGKPLWIEDIERDPRFGKQNIPQYNTKSLLSLPFTIEGRVVGVLNLNNKRSSEPFTHRDFYIASALCERMSHFIERLYSGNYAEDEFKKFLMSFESLLSAEKKYHKKKSLLPDLTMKVMEKIGCTEEEKKMALYASVIYDLGIALIDDSILLKKKKLLPSESRTLKIHPFNTVSLIEYFEYSDIMKNAILHHHERYDGQGYPDGLRGEEIPFLSRILSVLDAFCAMVADRPYRETYTKEKALEEIKEGAGTLYDPAIVKVLEEVISDVVIV